jgi:tellurite resistance protein
MTLFPDTPLDLHHIQAMVRAMHELAQTDGFHDAERVMLRGFYDTCQQDASALTSFDELIGTPFDAKAAKEIFDTPERRAALLQSCVFLAYADGSYSSGERAKVKSYADAVGASALELAHCEGLVSDHLLQQVSRISNVDALKQVAVELARR